MRTVAESGFRAAFVQMVSLVGEEAAWEIYEKLGKRCRGRPRGSKDPEGDGELQRLVTAINRPKRTPNAEVARLIHDAFPGEYGPTTKAIEMKIRRLMGNNI
jgi:hypothetical protein